MTAIDQLLPHLANGKALAAKLTPPVRTQFLAAMPSLKERAKTLVDLIDSANFLLADRPLPLDEKAKALLTEPAIELLRDLAPELGGRRTMDRRGNRTGGARLRRTARRQAWRGGAAAARGADRADNFAGIFEVLALLGKTESLGRIADQVQNLKVHPTNTVVVLRVGSTAVLLRNRGATDG